jgi:hypothetical protein
VVVFFAAVLAGCGDQQVDATDEPSTPASVTESKIRLDGPDSADSREWADQTERELRSESEASGYPQLAVWLADRLDESWRENDGVRVPVDWVGEIRPAWGQLSFCLAKEAPRPPGMLVNCRATVPIESGAVAEVDGLVRVSGELFGADGGWRFRIERIVSAEPSSVVRSRRCFFTAEAPSDAPVTPEIRGRAGGAFGFEFAAVLQERGIVAAFADVPTLLPTGENSWALEISGAAGSVEFAEALARATGMDVRMGAVVPVDDATRSRCAAVP